MYNTNGGSSTGSKLIYLLLVMSCFVLVIHGHLSPVQELKLITNVVKSHDIPIQTINIRQDGRLINMRRRPEKKNNKIPTILKNTDKKARELRSVGVLV